MYEDKGGSDVKVPIGGSQRSATPVYRDGFLKNRGAR